MTVRVACPRRVRLLGWSRSIAGARSAAARPSASTDTTGSISSGRARRAAKPSGAREADALGEQFRANPRDPDVAIRYAQALRATGQRAQAAAVLETAALHQPEQQGAARRLRPRARGCRQLQAGARRARARAFARPARLAHPLGAGRRARSDGPPRGSAALLRERAQDRAGRALGAVQSRPLLRALEGPEARRGDAAPRLRNAAAPTSACGKTSRWWSACRAASRKPRRSRAPTCRQARRPRMSLICAGCWRRRIIRTLSRRTPRARSKDSNPRKSAAARSVSVVRFSEVCCRITPLPIPYTRVRRLSVRVSCRFRSEC